MADWGALAALKEGRQGSFKDRFVRPARQGRQGNASSLQPRATSKGLVPEAPDSSTASNPRAGPAAPTVRPEI